jgi:hypothetical protein
VYRIDTPDVVHARVKMREFVATVPDVGDMVGVATCKV